MNEDLKIRAAVETARAVAEAVRDLGQVPSGHLYANLMGHMDLPTYDGIIETLVKIGVIKIDGFHLITWIGPSRVGDREEVRERRRY